MLKTKIVCTLGPASSDESVLREMMLAGMNVARFNFSHGDYPSHKEKADLIKKLRAELDLPVALMLDTKGPEIRLGDFKNGKVTLRAGQTFTLCADEIEGDENQVHFTYPGLYRDITIGTRILIDDGLIELRAVSMDEQKIVCEVLNGGPVSNHKGVNVPGVKLSVPFLSEKDRADIAFGVREDFDFIAASFTQSAQDILSIRAELASLGANDSMRIIAKIENAAGVANADEILEASDGIMVARGDMGVEIPMEDIPVIQKQLISKCYNAGKQVITATQMLESMTRQPRPTRAEITDVANAIYDGTSAIMLSGETAAGLYPVESVRTMARIAARAESDIDYRARFGEIHQKTYKNVTNAVSHAACTTAIDLRAAAIITVTKSGATARQISRYRPDIPIIGCSPDAKTCRFMNMSWGVTPVLMQEKTNTDELIAHALEVASAKKLIADGDVVVITAGIPVGISGTTNMLKVEIVGNVLVTGTGVTHKSVCGNLCVCHNDEEIKREFHDGDILVAPSVSSELLESLRHAAGIICELGGKDSYAAMVGEILNIPVIVGAVGATRILHSGTTVTMDSSRGLVFSGTLE